MYDDFSDDSSWFGILHWNHYVHESPDSDVDVGGDQTAGDHRCTQWILSTLPQPIPPLPLLRR